MVEYSSPNTNKPLHLGHLRNNFLGYSVSEILKAAGHKVIKANLINDRGIHICKSMLAWMKFGNGETPASSGMKGDHLVGKYYVIFNQKYEPQVAALVEQGMSKDEAKTKAPLLLEAQELLRRWEAHDLEVVDIWKTMNSWVYEGFESTYKSIGVSFDKFYYESQTYLHGKELVQDGLDKGVFFKKEDGSVWVDLTDEGLDQKLLLRGDGTSVYMTQDLGTAQQRFDEFALNRMIYVVGNEQDYHFKVLRLIFKKLGRPWYDAIYHLSYGMVELPEGKMKSREGTVVDADELVSEMLQRAGEETRELGKLEGLSDTEQNELFRKIAMAALKFYILKADPKKTMLFDPKESIEIQGFTGPFIQYTYARVRSIMRKSEELGYSRNINKLPKYFEDIKKSANENGRPEVTNKLAQFEKLYFPKTALSHEEKEVLHLLYKKDSVLQEAAQNLSPALLANYAYDLAKTYNKFYHERPVLKEADEKLRTFRLMLTFKTGECIRQTTALLGMEMPEKM
jgi:arginyl-tRNA synthetase